MWRPRLIVYLIALLFCQISYSQTVKNYVKEWTRVQELIGKQLPQSAFSEVKKIFSLAKADKQEAQQIKCLLYMMDLQEEQREASRDSSIVELEKELTGASETGSAILSSLIAETYWQYFNEKRWQIQQRTETIQFRKDQVSTWGAADFYRKISGLYLQSLKNEKLLQQTKLEPFDALIVKGNTRKLRPTLFDLLAFRALAYFANDETDLSRPADAFEIEQASAYSPAAAFVKERFLTTDSLSLRHTALGLYQRLLAFHLHDAAPDALIDADLWRIRFVHANSTHPDKDQLYTDALRQLIDRFGTHPIAAEASLLLASWYSEKAESYQAYGDSSYRMAYTEALKICDRVLVSKDSSKGWIGCYYLARQIKSQTIGLTLERVNLPDQAFRSLITYRNLNKVYLRLVKPDEKLKAALENRYDDEYWKAITGARSFKEWTQALPSTQDYQSHQAEIKLDGLPAGEYWLLASTEAGFSAKTSRLGLARFYVSSISYFSQGNDFFVVDRNSGQPLANATVQTWLKKYDSKTSSYITEKAKLFTTDASGYFSFAPKADKNESQYFYFDISYKKERLFLKEDNDSYYFYNFNQPVTPSGIEEKTYTHLFTDRSIYRPGQTVYFKGITIVDESEGNKTVRSGYQTTIYLRDANGQNKDSLKISTSDYGSFSGRFVLPRTGLNGTFSLMMKSGRGISLFRVEEYKRPKFYVEFDKQKQGYRVNDSISAMGKAKAYAGNTISGARIKYRVVRQRRYVSPWLLGGKMFPWQPPQEIAHGEIESGPEGKFSIPFKAIPDRSIAKEMEPVFDFTVYADVTDLNGETHSGEQKISVSYHSVVIQLQLEENMTADSLKRLPVRVENLSGETVAARVEVVVSRLKHPQRLIRKRFWERPDQFILGREEYIQSFPNDEYDNESDRNSWEKAETVFSGADTVTGNRGFDLRNQRFSPGAYRIEISTKDENGETIQTRANIEVYDPAGNQLPLPAYLSLNNPGKTEPGQSARLRLSSSAENLFVVQRKSSRMVSLAGEKELNGYSYLRLNGQVKDIDIPVQEEDRGGIEFSVAFVKNNRLFQESRKVEVPWSNKELSVEYLSFRDKTLPGSTEKWKVKISGYRADQVAAEMLASMYDASLDQIFPHQWGLPSIWPVYQNSHSWNDRNNFQSVLAEVSPGPAEADELYADNFYDELDGRGDWVSDVRRPGKINTNRVPFLRIGKLKSNASGAFKLEAAAQLKRIPGVEMDYSTVTFANSSINGDSYNRSSDTASFWTDDSNISIRSGGRPQPSIRKNFNETAFFLPDLKTDSSGAIEFSFTLPEALTRWKFQALAHTKELAFGYSQQELVTQKLLMVQPNTPRFLREGDRMELSAKIVNMGEQELTGQAELQLFDPSTNQPVDGRFHNTIPNQYFTVGAGQSEAIQFPIEVPYHFSGALQWRIVARAGEHSDGEQDALPVLTNRMLVTESMPLQLRGAGSKSYRFEKLLASGNSETIQHHSLQVSFSTNPAWYAVQALPYLMEFPYECAEQTWNRYYANSLGTMIANSSPKIKKIFEQWKTVDTAALQSALQQNEELKSALLEETPWVLEAKSEAEQKQRLAILFDLVKMNTELTGNLAKLQQMQSSNGGFVWFKGGPDNRYITQYILTGIGHLKKLKGLAGGQEDKIKSIVRIAIPYLDAQIKKDYERLVKSKTALNKYLPSSEEVQYLYMRSFFPEYKLPAGSQTAYDYFFKRAQLTWTQQNKFAQGMIALVLSRSKATTAAKAILRSLKETSINNEELGRYWKDPRAGWWWYEAPVERQALLIEAFSEIARDTTTADELRTWLLKNKQTNQWATTRSTADACYALLLQGNDWVSEQGSLTIRLGKEIIQSDDQQQTAGTGYFEKKLKAEEVSPSMGQITVEWKPAGARATSSSRFGAVYWQYFEDLDRITSAATPLRLSKKMFIETNSDRGPVLTPVNDGDFIKVGDKVVVRVVLEVDREMEFVHMKDLRAASLEPVDVLSGYRWQDGLGYYQSNRDASMNFFFDQLRKGSYVFEYRLFATHTGNFSNGITTIQCMYAPEFAAHSEGIRISIE